MRNGAQLKRSPLSTARGTATLNWLYEWTVPHGGTHGRPWRSGSEWGIYRQGTRTYLSRAHCEMVYTLELGERVNPAITRVIVIVVNSTIFWGKKRWNRWFLDYSVILSNHDGKLEKWEFLHHLIKWRWKLCECIIKYVFGRRLHFSRLTSKNLLIKNLERKLCIFWQEDYLYRKSVYIINSRKLQIACKMYTYIINRIQ